MCGIIASYSEQNSAQTVYQGLVELQHRGQDAAGIASLSVQDLQLKRGLGQVEDVFTQHSFADVPFAIGHTRYGTSGGRTQADSQPFYNEQGIALAHSGHLHQAPWMQAYKNNQQSLVDSNLLLQFLVHHLAQANASNEADYFAHLVQIIRTIFQEVKGAYSVVCLIAGKGLISFRDPHGTRPLVFGERINAQQKKDYLIASESHFFQDLDFQQQNEVQAGELIFISMQGQLFRQVLSPKTYTPCSFEYVYFAHPQSTLNGITIKDARQKMGQLLAQQWQENYRHLNPDLVLPIPHTAATAAHAFAQVLNIHYGDYFKINSQIGRTFIQAEHQERIESLNKKLMLDPAQVKNKKIILFDDSIVRGTTAKLLVKKLRAYGAKAIYLVSACPPIINICTYGINLASHEELLAANNSQEQIKAFLAVDELLYPTTEHLLTSINPVHNASPCMRCMKYDS